MKQYFNHSIKTVAFDEDYHPDESTRLTTNFANLARGEKRQENLRNTLEMINHRFNELAHWDNPKADRYSIALDIVSVSIDIEGKGETFPSIEFLNTTIIDHHNKTRTAGILGNSFSSYIRDYDFSVLLRNYNKDKSDFAVPDQYGNLHGKLFKYFLNSEVYKNQFKKLPVFCLSVATTRTYYRTENYHPILGVEYRQEAYSLTDEYFKKMGFQVRYFMPEHSVAPLAFYFSGDLLSDYTPLELIGTISTMESFQKIYRPEIYNANSAAGEIYQPSLQYKDYSSTLIEYDREERNQLAVKQGKYTEQYFIKPYQAILEEWARSVAL